MSTVPTSKALAKEFSRVINEWLSEDELRKVRLLNKTNTEHVCATHDFCDANMAMDEAWNKLAPVEIDIESELHTRLWNSAWSIAKHFDFHTNEIEGNA